MANEQKPDTQSNQNAGARGDGNINDAQETREVQDLNQRVPSQSSNSSASGGGGSERSVDDKNIPVDDQK